MEKLTGNQCLKILFQRKASLRVCEIALTAFGRKGLTRIAYGPVLSLEKEGLVERHRIGSSSFVSLTGSGETLVQYDTSLMKHLEPHVNRTSNPYI